MFKLKKLVHRGPKYIFYFVCLIVFYVLGFFARAFSMKYRDVWIISERGTDARDNGYHFYKYVRTWHPEINAYYIIDKSSADYKKVEKYGNVVDYRSFKHHLLFAVSTHKISSHIFGYAPDILCYNRFQKLNLIYGKRVFLQHGITCDNITWMFYPNTKLDLFVCGAKPEYEAVCRDYGFPSGVIQYLGLCRYDALKSDGKIKRQILFMPTWRQDIRDTVREKDFMKSLYYKSMQEILNSGKLVDFLEKNGYDMVFYPHYEVQKFLDTFSAKSSRVKIASFNDYDVQTLLIESELLITDYSSVLFDFGYMYKPCVFFQFDVKEFRERHYAEGYFSYERDAFGPIFDTASGVVDYVVRRGGDGFVIEKEYAKRVDVFFEKRDNDNCKRNFEAIKSL